MPESASFGSEPRMCSRSKEWDSSGRCSAYPVLPLYCFSRNVNRIIGEGTYDFRVKLDKALCGYLSSSESPVISIWFARHRHEMFKASGRTDAIVQPSNDRIQEVVEATPRG